MKTYTSSSFLLLATLLLLSFSFGANAQVLPEKEEKTTLVYPDLPPAEEIPLVHLEEMEAIEAECEQDLTKANFKNCRCYAMNFLARRLETPNVEAKFIHPLLEHICYDPVVIAGSEYRRCINTHADTAVKDWVKLCGCFANTVAKKTVELDRITYVNMRSIKRNAYGSCRFYN